jgi:virulence-associated protein VapD
MTNTSPGLGRNGSITINGAEAGYITNVTFDMDAAILKDYKFTSDIPAVLESGNKTFKFAFDRMYIDTTYASLVLAGTKMTILLGPMNSTPSGQPKYTLSNAIIFHHSFRDQQGGIVMENGTGEAASVVVATY